MNDSLGVSNGQLSLREAVHASNTNAAFGDAAAGSPDGDTIVFSDSLRGETVQVQQGEFVLSDDIRIIGSTVGAGLSPGLTLSAGGLSRLFEIKTPGAAGSRADVQISNLILSDGRATAAVGGNGGAVLIQSNEDVTFRNVTVRDSIAAGNGGGISVGRGRSLVINGGSLLDNVAGRNGGGLWKNYARLTILDGVNDVTIDGNLARGSAADAGGGGIYSSGCLVNILDISDNIVTISNNRATGTSGSGGGIWSQLTGSARLTVTNSTITLNNAQRSGGGIWTNASTAQVGSAAVLSNTIVAQNTANMSAPDIRRFGRLFAFNSLVGNGVLSGLAGGANGNLIGSNTCVINAKLGTLSDNGGPTATHALLAGSPAINRGKNSRAINIAGDPLTTDQRGDSFARIRGGIVDIGATEATPMTGCATTRVVRTT